MIIYLQNNQQIAGNDLLAAILRVDLVPIPVTLELTLNASDMLKEQVVVGNKLLTANGIELQIVKVETMTSQVVKDGKRIGAMAVIAVLAGCEALINTTKKAVSHDGASFSEIYRSLGAKVKFGNDIKVNSFVCLKGQIPTKRIALALQKEACVLVYDIPTKTLNVRRIQELLESKTASVYDPSAVQWIANNQAIARQNTHYLSLDDNGSDVLGQVSDNKSIDYMPRCDNRELHNLKRILVTCGVIIRALDDKLVAGNVISVSGKNLVILTSAIRIDTGSMGGQSVMASKAWLAKMVET